MNEPKRVQKAFDKAVIEIFKEIKKLDKTKTFVVGQKSYKYLESIVDLYGSNQSIIFVVDRNELFNHRETFETLKLAYSRIDFKNFKNDTFALTWLKERGLLRGNTKHLAPYIDKILANKQDAPITRYHLRMILIERKEYSYNQFLRDLDDIYLDQTADLLVPIIPYKHLLEKTDWAEEEISNVKLVIKVNSDYSNELFDKIFLGCPSDEQ